MIVEAKLQKAMVGIANDFRNALVRAAPVNTGFLKNNIVAAPVEDGIVVTMPFYAMFVEFGTAPHVITPKQAKALHWKAEGTGPRGGKNKNDVFVMRVQHPGTTANPFIRNTIRSKLKPIIVQNFERQLAQ